MGSDRLFCFASISKFSSFKKPFTMMSELDFRCITFCWYKRKSGFYELWQQHKQLKTMEISDA